ncbi:MAG: hypothetical protein GF365_04585 [Candidatus Buchananbacteria bacterium]|nr:hypothetical protein [Candidatus Buchananbacteria bacterium]
MKKINLLFTLLIILTACGPQEVERESPTHPKGTVEFAGIEFQFNFYLNEIKMTNHNNDPVKVKMINLTTNATLINDLITWPGNTQVRRDLSFGQGEEIEIQIWQGYSSVWDGNINNRAPDFQGTGTLNQGQIKISNFTNKWGYQIDLPIVNGAECAVMGQYVVDDPNVQTNNLLYCERVGSDTLQIELYLLQPATGGGYEDDFELTSFWMVAQLGEDLENGQISINFSLNTPLALRVITYDPFDNTQKNSDIYGFKLDVVAKTYTEIIDPITIDPVPPPSSP